MTDLLIYVDNTASCSVFFNSEERDVTLETFRCDILMEQVHDVLDFPYKFTRLIQSERVVVGAKQESVIKLSQCLLGDTEPILFLVSEKKDELPEPEPEEKDGKEKQQNEFVESPESLDDEPPSTIAKASRQSTITEFASTS